MHVAMLPILNCCCIVCIVLMIVYMHGCCVFMQKDGQYIEWEQMCALVEKQTSMASASHGISLIPKLKLEHVKLTSFSKMRVDLAAQVRICHCLLVL